MGNRIGYLSTPINNVIKCCSSTLPIDCANQ